MSAPTPIWRRLDFYMGTQPFGCVVSHEVIALVLGAGYGSEDYYRNVRSAIANQLERKRHWMLERDIGYRLLYPHEIHILAASQVSTGRRRVQSGAKALLHRDSQNIPKQFDKSYAASERALAAMGELLECVEEQTRIVGGSEVFDTIRAAAIRACAEWKKARERRQVSSHRSRVDWDVLVCQGHRKSGKYSGTPCNTVLLKHRGVVDSSSTGIEIVCRNCKTTNYLFGGSDHLIAIDAEQLGAMSSMRDARKK